MLIAASVACQFTSVVEAWEQERKVRAMITYPSSISHRLASILVCVQFASFPGPCCKHYMKCMQVARSYMYIVRYIYKHCLVLFLHNQISSCISILTKLPIIAMCVGLTACTEVGLCISRVKLWPIVVFLSCTVHLA
jgi:hypothetical protein